jgi:hypothetical protein
MNEILLKILNNPENKKVLHFLIPNQNMQTNLYFKTWEASISGYNEGGCIFFEDYGQYIADNCKYVLDIHSIMINKNSGEIFAFNTGRFSVFFKCDFVKSAIENTDDLRRGYTLDCISDITALREQWCFMDEFDDQKDQLKWSYELTNK